MIPFLRGLKLKYKVIIPPALAVLVLLLILAIARSGSQRSSALLVQIEEDYFPSLQLNRDMEETLKEIQRGFQDAATSSDQDILEETIALEGLFRGLLKKAERHPSFISTALDNLGENAEKYFKLAEQVTLQMIEGELDANSNLLEEMIKRHGLVKSSLASSNDILKRGMSESFHQSRELQKSSQRQMRVITLISFALILVLIFLSVVIVKSLTIPLNTAVKLSTQLAKGNLTAQIGAVSQDEIGQLQGSLKQVFQNLNRIIRDINHSALQVSESARDMEVSSNTLKKNAHETAEKLNSVSSATQSVSKNTDSVATSIDEMNASMKEISKNAISAAQVATEAVDIARITKDKISQLEKGSQDIEEIIKVITVIAHQTNLLALNATIEAARAGEKGKGFAVVASEVKDLARKTAHATEEITEKIKSIQPQIQESVTAIDKITETTHQIHEIQNAIASGVEEQSAVTREINDRISQTSKETSGIANDVVAVASVAKNTQSHSEKSTERTHLLVATAKRLKELMKQFTIKDTEE